MSVNVTEILKEATKGILTEETLTEIEGVFTNAVNENVKLHTEKALLEQDADYTKKLEVLLEAIDNDHTNKLNKVVAAIDVNHTGKLQTIVERHNNTINKEAKRFKDQLVGSVSKYMELYIDEKIPSETIQEAVRNRRAFDVLNETRKLLAVDKALSNGTIREAVVDGKNQIDTLKFELAQSKANLKKLTESFDTTQKELVLEKKLSELDPKKRNYMHKLLKDKPLQYIKENFDYALSMFDKTEEERIGILKEQATRQTQADKVDRVVIEEDVETPEPSSPMTNVYMTELKKY